MNTHRNLRVNADRLSTSMKRLSSGLRINSAADDAAGLTIAERMRAQVRGLEQANRNINDGISMLQVAEGALHEVHSILQRARELAVQHASDTTGFEGRVAIREELIALSAEIARIQDVTEFNGVKLLQSNTAVLTLQVGANQGEIVTITLVDLFGGTVGDLVRPVTFLTLPWIPADIEGFDLHIADVANARGRLGAAVNRLEHSAAANGVLLENIMSAESRIRDVDMAAELTNLSRTQLLSQSGTMALLFAQQSPNRLLDLLR